MILFLLNVFFYFSFCVYVCVCTLSHICLFVTPWTIAHQAPLSMGFFRQEYWSRLPSFPSPGDLPDLGMEPTSPRSPALQADSLPLTVFCFSHFYFPLYCFLSVSPSLFLFLESLCNLIFVHLFVYSLSI